MRRAFKIFGIVSIPVVVVAMTLFWWLTPSSVYPPRWETANVEMREITKALNSHWLETKEYPDSLDALKKDYFKNGVPKNPYTKEHYDYFTNGDRFFLVCYGHDNKAGGAEPPDADIVYTEAGCLTR